MTEGISGNFAILLLLLIALAAAWLLGYRRGKSREQLPGRKLERDYFIGLNYLLNDEPDDAVDIFIDVLEVNSSTLESYMALATLLRRRGKVDRSITVYQNLLANSRLSADEINQVKLGLVRSYVAAGLLDRAERLIDELRTASLEVKLAALNQGISVYQLEKEWHKAVAVIDEIIRICPPSQRLSYQGLSSHFFCEMAQEEMVFEHFNQARDYLRRAMQLDRNNVRVSLLLGEIEYRQGNYRKAVTVLRKIELQDSAFFPEALPLLIKAYRQAGMERDLERFVDVIAQEQKAPAVVLEITDYLESSQGRSAAKDYIMRQLHSEPSLEVVRKARSIIADAPEANVSLVSALDQLIDDILKNKSRYQCTNCGFELKKLHWLCPGCNKWGSIRPIRKLLLKR